MTVDPSPNEERISQVDDFQYIAVNLTKLVAKNCKIRMNEPPKAASHVLVLESLVPADYSSLLKVSGTKFGDLFVY